MLFTNDNEAQSPLTKDFLYERSLRVPHFVRSSIRLPFEELYDLASDPEEQTNLADDPGHAAIRRELSDTVDAWMADCGDKGIESELDVLRKYPAKATGKQKAGVHADDEPLP